MRKARLTEHQIIAGRIACGSPVFRARMYAYCLALTQTLAGQRHASETEKHLSWLLYDLISVFAAGIKAPRWLRTADGLKLI